MINSKKNNPKFNRKTRKRFERLCKKLEMNVPLEYHWFWGTVALKANTLEFVSPKHATNFCNQASDRLLVSPTQVTLRDNTYDPCNNNFWFCTGAKTLSQDIPLSYGVVAVIRFDGKREEIKY